MGDTPRPGAREALLPDDEDARVAALHRYGVLDTAEEAAYDELVELAAIVCDVPMAALSFVDRDRQWFKARRGLQVGQTPRDVAFCAHTILGDDVLEVPDARADPRFETNELVTGDPHVQFYAAAPVRTPDAHNIGTVCVLDTQPRSLTDQQRRALRSLASHAMDELDLRQALAEKQAIQTLFETLVHKAKDIMATIAPDGSILYATPNVTELLGFEIEELFGTNSFRFVHAADLEAAMANFAGALEAPGVPQTAPIRIRDASGGWKHLMVTATSYLDDPSIGGVVVNITDRSEQVEMTDALAASEARFRHLVQHSSDIIAIIGRDHAVRYVSPAVNHVLGHPVDEVIGHQVVDLVHPAQRHLAEAALRGAGDLVAHPPPVEVRLRHADGRWLWFEIITSNLLADPTVNGLVVNARDITERKEYEAQLVHEALHDPLTGLPNRVLLEDRLEQALGRSERHEHQVALLFLDIDRFKMVNDSSGHAIGDLLLVQTARRLEEAIRAGDSVVRFGGDEFVVLCEGTTLDEALALAQRIREQLCAPVMLKDRSFFLDVSVGIAMAQPADDAGTLLQAADTAMYLAKERGRGRVEVYEPGLREQATTRAALLSDLHHAVERGELVVAYQPIVRLSDRTCVGVEALLRWHHPDRGTVPPDEFIPLAEESGMIIELGHHVLTEAVTSVRRWREVCPAFYVSVNMSARQLREPGFTLGAEELLQAEGLEPDALVLELTESILMQQGEATRQNLEAARASGIRVAVDDFGTGYSSLAYLKLLAVALLKIDGSFVQGLGKDPYDTSIVAAIASLGTTLGLTVVAEHVESEAQRTELVDLGCAIGQGFLFSPAVDPSEVDQLLAGGATFPEVT